MPCTAMHVGRPQEAPPRLLAAVRLWRSNFHCCHLATAAEMFADKARLLVRFLYLPECRPTLLPPQLLDPTRQTHQRVLGPLPAYRSTLALDQQNRSTPRLCCDPSR